MNRTYLKNILRDIKNTKGKVLSILLMVGLAASVVVGLSLSGTTMRTTLNKSLRTYGHPDIIVTSTYGLDYEDELILKNDPAIEKMSLVKAADLMDGETLIRLKSIDENIPKSQLTAGRLPAKKGELALDQTLADTYKIGDKIKFSYIENARIKEEMMAVMDYEIVGFYKSSDYFMEDMRQMSYTAKKELNGYGLVTAASFDTDKYGEINISYKPTATMDINSAEYRAYVRNKQEEIEDAIANRPHEVLKDVKDEANDELDEAAADIADAKKEISDAERKLTAARDDLNQGYKDYEEGKKTYNEEIAKAEDELKNSKNKLEAAETKLAAGKNEYQRNLTNFNNRISAGQNEIRANERNLNQAESELRDAQARVNQGLRDLDNGFAGPRAELARAKNDLDQALAEINQKENELRQLEVNAANMSPDGSAVVPYDEGLNPATNTYISQAQLEAARAELNAARSRYEAGLSDYNANKAALDKRYNNEKASLDTAQAEINNKRAELDNGWARLNNAKAELNSSRTSGQNELNKALAQLNASEAEINNGWNQYNEGLATLESKRETGKKDLEDAYQELLDGESEYKKSKADFDKEKADALDEIAEGEEEIADSKQALGRLADPEYEVETIFDNEGINTYYQNSLNMDELTKVFPTFFYLVAMLVTLTTMKRYIDEQRTINGTLKAMGYPNNKISGRFYIYGIIPTLVGAIIGALFGRFLISKVIINAYSSGFGNLGIVYGNSLPYILFAIILSVVLIAFTIYFSSKETVRQTPASLLRPKAPNVGKKIFLERINPLWDKMNFMAKVTARNIFRYKSRMFMTLFGVGGCTALTFFGFAMIDSITETLRVEQDEISHYDVIAILDENANDDELNDFKKATADFDSLDIRYDEITVSKVGERRDFNVVIPSDTKALKDFVSLRTPKRQAVDLANEDAVMTEKASKILGINPGDSIQFNTDGEVFDLPISNIVENYTGDYIYISAETIDRLTGDKLIMDAAYLKGDADNIIKDIEDQDAVLALINASVIYASIDVLMANLNLVIGVITLISVMLALVVLYNLININVSERKRELATIKVLGFYPKEVTSYIFREIFILTLLGILVGYIMGYAMFRYIISVVAPEDIMLYYRVGPRPFIYSALITIAISLVLLLVVHKRLQIIDMAEAMSSGE